MRNADKLHLGLAPKLHNLNSGILSSSKITKTNGVNLHFFMTHYFNWLKVGLRE